MPCMRNGVNMTTTNHMQNPGVIEHSKGACVRDESTNMPPSKENRAGSTIRCDDKTDCEIRLLDSGEAGKFINLGQHLKEHRRMRQSLSLAQEVQQNLLPRKTPQMTGLDIAGKSIYCDETGGDYFDYHHLGETGPEQLGVAIGDVSGHGISAALLMAAVRAALRQRVSLGGRLKDIISDVNRQLVGDIEESGQFIGLFYLAVDLRERSLKWVRAGHAPAIVYDPATDTIEELNGPGLALGVDANHQYTENVKRLLKKGQVIVLATDGILEARNPAGRMYGMSSIVNLLRRYKSAVAEQILDVIFRDLQHFQQEAELEDDVTLVVIKIDNED